MKTAIWALSFFAFQAAAHAARETQVNVRWVEADKLGGVDIRSALTARDFAETQTIVDQNGERSRVIPVQIIESGDGSIQVLRANWLNRESLAVRQRTLGDIVQDSHDELGARITRPRQTALLWGVRAGLPERFSAVLGFVRMEEGDMESTGLTGLVSVGVTSAKASLGYMFTRVNAQGDYRMVTPRFSVLYGYNGANALGVDWIDVQDGHVYLGAEVEAWLGGGWKTFFPLDAGVYFDLATGRPLISIGASFRFITRVD